MILHHISKEDLSKMIQTIIKKHIKEPVDIFYFGSRVDGTGDDRSDIDVGVIAPFPLSLSTLNAIKEDLENLPILYTIDLVDFSNASDAFKRVALRYREQL